MAYVDGFLVPVPRRKLNAYLAMSRKCGKIWRKHGAIEYRECVADDVKKGKWTSFPQSVKLKRGEVVVYSWIVYKTRAARDKTNKAVFKDPRMAPMMNPKKMPFDGKRMMWGGFKLAVDL
ncbi:MAG: DUF1428 domain-containing protein [Pseudolabrys sp.]